MIVDIDGTNVDDQIYQCINLNAPVSFFLYAGAGSGKTRSLVRLLTTIQIKQKKELNINGQKVAVITYTNAARDEIKGRLEYDSLFLISTIHSFVWELIKPYQSDIKKWLKVNLEREIVEIEAELNKGRPGTKTAIDRKLKIEAKKNRLENIEKIKRFSYNPNGDNRNRDSLNHSEVISIGADFLTEKTLMQNVLINKYPVLLIDESQDTKKELIDAFLEIQKKISNKFLLGLFGDTMQRIYSDGKENLENCLPENWIKPSKIINYRCPKRVITLINKIRSNVDDHQQEPIPEKEDGFVRLFIISNRVSDKIKVENEICKKMAKITDDELWNTISDVKFLILEHHMAARRMGFIELFEPLYKIDQFRTGLIDGSLPGINFFTHTVLPLVTAKKTGDEFAAAQVVRQYSPIISRENLKQNENQLSLLKKANESVNLLLALWKDGKTPSLLEVLKNITDSGLFIIPDSFELVVNRDTKNQEFYNKNSLEEDQDSKDELISAWDQALACPFNQIESYNEYISNKARFGTHQGVKGLEFPRVMVILDDEEAKGFLFSYEKLFGAKLPSQTDIKNEQDGKETSIDRTRRLFYVTCSRAEKSLAVVAYTSDPKMLKDHVISQGWFNESEIEEL